MSENRFAIWNETSIPGSEYHITLIEQYKLYAEMADRISGRRALANTLLLGINTTLVTASSTLFSVYKIPPLALIAPLVALLCGCGMWLLLLRSYRQLNSKKYRIIGAMEERLPASPWKVEWKEIEKQKGRSKYWRLSLLEQCIPIGFAIMYTTSYVAYAW